MRTVDILEAPGAMRPDSVRRRLATVLAIVMVVTLSAELPAAAATEPVWQPPKPADVAGTDVTPIKNIQRLVWTAGDREVRGAPQVTWPTAGKVDVDITPQPRADGSRITGTGVQVGELPVRIAPVPLGEGADVPNAGRSANAPVSRATVEVADRAAADRAGVSGLVLKLNRADGIRSAGSVKLEVDYSGFAGALGAGWTSRLRLVRLPDGLPYPTDNNVANRTLTAAVPLAADGSATMLAVSSGPSGDSGDFTATSLSSASTWQVSQQTGAFVWSYPLRVPPAVGGPEPSLALGHSSSSVDGRTAGNNSQGSWIGDGWDLWPGYIERQYKGCADDKDEMRDSQPNNKTVSGGDLCWLKPEGNATISFNGQATELVKSTGNTWKGVADDGSKIELLQSATIGNGDEDGEYWKVTAVDGTQYFFGRHTNPGGASGSTATNSVWTVPVYGNHPDEPGYKAGDFAGSRKTKAWRWNLDAVIDPHGSTMTYFYQRETGAYGREGDVNKRTTYDRGGWLSRIEYGNRVDAAGTTRAAAQVLFDEADRCVSNCWSGGDPVEASWRDTPWDQFCAAAPCTDKLSPTFWTAKRLSRVRSQVYSGSGTNYDEVEWWTLRHTYLQAGGNDGEPMWLTGITRTGKVTSAGGTEVSDPEVIFDPGAEALENRVDGMADGRSDLFRYRIDTITTESGAQIAVTYKEKDCQRSALPTEHNNTKRCFPQYWAPEGEEPELDWFHKYVVDRIDVYDNTGGFEHEQTNYDYLDTPAWHYDDSELVDEEKRTWGQFRGYGRVQVRMGLEAEVQSATEYRYFRGMHGDKQLNGTRSVTVTDSQGVSVQDHESFSGMLRESITLLGAEGSWIAGSISTPVRQGPTATSGPLKSWMTNVGTIRNRGKLSSGATRWTKAVTTYNADNLPTQVEDLGDESTTSDDRCTRTWYARNQSNWMLNRVKRSETVAVNCSATPSLPTDVLDGSRVTYDLESNDWNTYLPVEGDPVKTEEIGSWSGSTPNWVTTARAMYDDNGRSVESYDALDRKTATVYTPLIRGPVTSSVQTNPLGHSATRTMASAWGLPVTMVDNANGLRSDLTYDGAGRLRKVWHPGRSKSTYPNGPNTEYQYLVRNNAPTAVTTKSLLPNGSSSYRTDIVLYDGLLRLRQTQTSSPGGGRFLTDTFYDPRGLVERTFNPYHDPTNVSPNTNLVGPEAAPPPSIVENIYDGAGRLTNAILMAGVSEKWRTVTSYAAERTNVTPPLGGTATTTVVDARGNAVELRQYRDRADVGSDDQSKFVRTTYGHTPVGELSTVTDQLGNTWRYAYDQRGRKIREEDPDTGVTSFTYDAAGQLVTSKDARNITLANTYDDLGRRTTLREGSTTGPKRAEWVYDTLQYGAGQLTKSIRYEPAGSSNAYVNEVTAYDATGRPNASRMTIPASEGGLCASGITTPCSYDYATTYRSNGDVSTTTLPAAAGLASEKLSAVYNDVGLRDGLLTPTQIYAGDTFDKLGRLNQRILGAHGQRTFLGYTVDQATGRLTNVTAIPEARPEVANFSYFYDQSGNLTKIRDEPANGVADTQCFSYDHLIRLTNAWTPGSGDCDQPRTVAGLGGPAKYGHSYTYDDAGNRLTETQHATTNTVRTYSYPAPGGPAGSRPHAVSQVTTTGARTGTESFTYDGSGNTKTRPGGANGQTLTWDQEGHLAGVTDSTGATSYLYDADGNRLIRRDPAGATLYLPGGMEVRKPNTGAATGTRYYSQSGTTIAVRTATGLSWLVGDHHGTAEITVKDADLSVARRRTLPFGGVRGTTSGEWPGAMDKGFVGGTVDNTGLTHLGAREYDSKIGRFISVDPIISPGEPQQINGYSYANNNPTTYADPSGLYVTEVISTTSVSVLEMSEHEGRFGYVADPSRWRGDAL